MFGDLILWMKKTWKQFWCIHEYKIHHFPDYHSHYKCEKCDRIRDDSI